MPESSVEKFLEKEPVDAVDTMKAKVAAMQEKLAEEVKRAEKALAEKEHLERKLEMRAEPLSPTQTGESLSAKISSTQIMRVMEHWIRHRDIEEVLLRRVGLTDESFATLVHVLQQSPSLHTVDLSENELTQASVSDLAQLITVVGDLQMISVAGNSLPITALGYLMTAMLERQAQGLDPPVLINFRDNQGLLHEENHGADALNMQERCATLCKLKVSLRAANLLVTVSKALWKFLVDTGHPLLPSQDPDVPDWGNFDEATHGKLLEALRPIVIYEEVINDQPRSLSAWVAIAEARAVEDEEEEVEEVGDEEVEAEMQLPGESIAPVSSTMQTQPVVDPLAKAGLDKQEVQLDTVQTTTAPKRMEKATTFNIKQIVTKNGMILMNILDRMLETTAIDATDVETDRTLLEYASLTGNMSLAKLCFRRGMNMSALTKAGDTAFNIATRRKDYQMMEFLHMYGVKVNSADAEGRTALHVATSGNDIDGICRLIEWGADINLKDHKKRTPLHFAAMGGYMPVAMLLLELSAELNAKDEKNFTAVAHAEATDHFELMDRLVQLGGKHATDGQICDREKIPDAIGVVTQPKFMRKSASLLRLGKSGQIALP